MNKDLERMRERKKGNKGGKTTIIFYKFSSYFTNSRFIFIERNIWKYLEWISEFKKKKIMEEIGERCDVELIKNEFNFSSVRKKFLEYYFKIKIESLEENKICFMVN